MRRIIAVIAVVAVAAAWTLGRPTPAASEDGIAVYFSPRGGCNRGHRSAHREHGGLGLYVAFAGIRW